MSAPPRHVLSPILSGRRGTALAITQAMVGLLLVGLVGWPAPLLGSLLYVAGALLRPWIVPSAVALAVPYYLHPTRFGGLEFSVAEIAVGLGVAGILAHVGLARLWRLTPMVRPPQGLSLDWAAGALVVAGLLSLLPSEFPRQSLRDLRWSIIEPIALFYVVRFTVLTSAQSTATLGALVASGTLAGAISLGDLALRGALGDLSSRATAPYLSPNHLGLFLERVGSAGLALALFGERRAWPWAASAVMTLALTRSLSLGAWIGFGCAALVLTALRSRRWFRVTLAALALTALTALLILPRERTLDRLDPATGTGLFRLQVWVSSLAMVRDHPVLGIGLDNYLYLYRGGYMLPEAWEEPNISHPHNWLLHFWLQLGLPGLAAGIATILWMAGAAHRRFRGLSSASDRPLAAAAVGTLVAFLVHGAVDNGYFLMDLAVVWWLLLGLLARDSAPPTEPSARIRSERIA